MKMHGLWKNIKTWSYTIYWVFLVLFLISAGASIIALRHNNQTMIVLRGDLYIADKNNGDVEGALDKLRTYIYGHVNTNLSSGGNTIKPPIQLKYTYERLQAAEKAKTQTSNSQIYTDAESYCQRQNPTDFSGRNRVPCVTAYVTSHGAKANPIPVGLYEFDFVSPTWSPDFAGWSLVLSSLLFIGLTANYLIYRLARARS